MTPFLRVIRDRRGYETTYLMHLYREGHRQRSRILYVFRTPGGVRVGRDPLDQDVRRRLEDRYREIDFDWNAIREGKQQIEMAEPRRRRPRRDGAPATAAQSPAPEVSPATAEPAVTPPPRVAALPSAVEGATPDEQMAFLAHWYPIVLARIPQRTSDPTRQTALTALAERLNPAAWTDADEIAAGLPQASEALERLSRVFSRRRRRSRRRPTGPPAGSETPPTE